jgi:glutamate-1-semialdehyde 2,1-aminomutase
VKSITEEYIARHPKSRDLFGQSLQSFPSGVTHDARHVTPFPLYMSHAKGPRKWDVDGNEYIGYVMGHGALLLGHNHPEVVKAVKRQLDRGTHLGANTELELAWSLAVKRLVPSVEKMRFHSSGTESTLTVPPGHIDVVEKTLKKDKDIAAVILEPTGASMGCYPVMPDFLSQLREVTERYEAILIFDEVVTGFRISSGGAQHKFGIKPDLSTFGKILGGGLPGGAVGGRAEILDLMSFSDENQRARERRVPHPGTYNANPLSASAGARCLEIVASEPVNDRADEAASQLKRGFNQIMKNAGISGLAYGLCSLVRVLFGVNYEGSVEFCSLPHDQIARGLAAPQAGAFKRAMANAGVDTMAGNLFIVSAVHGKREVSQTLEAFEKTVGQMRREGLV